jgi:nucleoside-diphosphate-sugar epimerase
MDPLRSVLVTGAGGFVGSALVPVLRERGFAVTAVTRAEVGEIGPGTNWAPHLRGIDAVVHLAARVHVTAEETQEAAAEYDRVNRAGTQRLAEAAVAAGVRRFVFLSSVKVMGEATSDAAFRETDRPQPVDPYGVSKLAAEAVLAEITLDSETMSAVALRPPLVYGPNVKANFRALLRLCSMPLPLPFGAVRNHRSLIFVGNLVDAIARVLTAEMVPPFHSYLLRDSEDLSTGELVRHLRRALGRPPMLLPVPPRLLDSALRLAGKGAMADRLLRSLQVDDRTFRRDFAWKAPISAAQGLAETARWYRDERRRPS